MKKIIITITALTLTFTLFAQENNSEATTISKSEVTTSEKKSSTPETQTLFGGLEQNLTFSGFGAPTVGITKLGDSYSVLTGFRGGLIINGINHGMVIGFAGSGNAYPYKREDITGKDYNGLLDEMSIGYGGLLLEYHYKPRSLFHFSIANTIGGGGVNFHESRDEEDNSDSDHNGDVFFATEPEITLYVNLAKFCRVGLSGSYRYSYGIDSEDFNDKDFRNFTGRLKFEFGWF